jgi:glycosyltransferase involved in cell wall biosynthesis
MSDLISIALATYNGSKYITEMLDSIAQQTHSHFMVNICDDGSVDNTIDIIKEHKLFDAGKIIIHDTEGGNGALKNFKRTIDYCSNGYIALCDQDDYWVPQKLEILLKKIKETELVNSGPVLVFSDLEIVDSNLNCQYPSFYSVSGKSSECRNPKDFLISNHIPGCAMLFNNELKTMIEPIPDDVRMHDWWIAIIAACFGKIVFEPESLIKYRQHGGNTIGAADMIEQKTTLLQLIKNTRTIVRRSHTLQKNLLSTYTRVSKKENVTIHFSADFISFINHKMNIIQKQRYLKNMHSGETNLLTYCAKWFI